MRRGLDSIAILLHLSFLRSPTGLPIGNVRVVQSRAESGDLRILRRGNVHDLRVVVDVQVSPVGKHGAVFPLAIHSRPRRSAMDRVDDDALRDGRFARNAVIQGSLCEGLIARDEDHLQIIGRVAPGQFLRRLPDDPAAVLVSPVGGQGEEFLRNRVEVRRQGHDLANPSSLSGEPIIAVFIEGHLDLGLPALLLGEDELIDDRPQFRPRLVDQARHAPTGVQQNGDLDQGLGGCLRYFQDGAQLYGRLRSFRRCRCGYTQQDCGQCCCASD